MNRIDRLERDLTVWFADTATPQTPPYFNDILQQTASLRQRPRWTFPERFFPMSAITTFRAVTSPVPWRTIGVLALLLVALVIGALLVGSAQRRLPAPFGLAGPGLVAFDRDGDIFVVDPATNQPRAIVQGSEDHDPQWSRDGTRLVFKRGDGALSDLYTVNADGSELTLITPSPVNIANDDTGADYAFSPDGRSVLFMGLWTINIAQADGSGVRQVPVEGFRPSEATFRPPDGRQLGVIGVDGGVYILELATGAVSTVVEPAEHMADEALAWSPDGLHLAYHRWDTTAAEFTVRGHILDLASRIDRPADPSESAPWDGVVTFSNDGKRIALLRGYTPSGYDDMTLAIMPSSGPGLQVETPHGSGVANGYGATIEWAPDDQSILLMPVDSRDQPLPQLLINPDTAAVTPVPWNAAAEPAWQRLAP